MQSLLKYARPLKFLAFGLLLAALAYLAIVQLKYLFFSTSYFELKKVVVLGAKTFKEEDVLRLANIAPGANVLTLNRDEVRDRLLLHPVIQGAEVELQGLYTLIIKLRERVPLLYVKSGSLFYEVSDDGIVLSMGEVVDKDLPLVTGVEVGNRRIGDSLAENDGFLEGSQWVKKLSNSVWKKVSEFNVGNLQNPYLYFLTGEKIIPKSLEDFQERFLFLCALLDNLRRNNVETDYLDMRAPSEIVVKPRRIGKP